VTATSVGWIVIVGTTVSDWKAFAADGRVVRDAVVPFRISIGRDGVEEVDRPRRHVPYSIIIFVVVRLIIDGSLCDIIVILLRVRSNRCYQWCICGGV
jgi:hypothetical protein